MRVACLRVRVGSDGEWASGTVGVAAWGVGTGEKSLGGLVPGFSGLG